VTIEETTTENLTLTIGKLKLNYQSLLKMNKGTIVSERTDLESQGLLQMIGSGYRAEEGFGKGRTVNGDG